MERGKLLDNSNKIKLHADDIDLTFGGVRALMGVSLEIREGEILALIGPNGAGKTCMINCIDGFYRPQKGRIYFEDKEITHLAPHKIAEMGISRTFQNLALYTGMSTLENLMAARHAKLKYGTLKGAIYFGWAHNEEIEHRKRVEDIIDLLDLEPMRKKPVGALPYGQRKKVELGRALALEPRLLLLDEPMAGMNVEEKEDMARYILDVHDMQGTTILLVEHDMGLVMDIAERIVALDFGQKIAEGSPAEIKEDEKVLAAYLGKPKEG